MLWRRWARPRERWNAEVGTAGRKLEEVVEAKRALGLVDIPLRQLELFEEQFQPALRECARDFQADRLGQPALAERAFDEFKQIIGFFARTSDFRAADDSQRVSFGHLHAREEHREVGGDQVFDEDKPVITGIHEPWTVPRHLHAREPVLPRNWMPDVERQRKATAGDERERVSRVHDKRRQHGEDRSLEVRRQAFAGFGLQVTVADDPDAVFRQLGCERLPPGLVVSPASEATIDHESTARQWCGSAVWARGSAATCRSASPPASCKLVQVCWR